VLDLFGVRANSAECRRSLCEQRTQQWSIGRDQFEEHLRVLGAAARRGKPAFPIWDRGLAGPPFFVADRACQKLFFLIFLSRQKKEKKINPSRVMERYVLHWGERGARWGVNRSVSQIHALLYLVGKPLTADEIAETLSIARSNVSTSLKELQNW